jgi:nucleoside phosphorylase
MHAMRNKHLMTTDLKTIVVLIALPEEHAEFQAVFPVTNDHSTPTQVRLEHGSGRDGIRLISVLAEQMGSQSALFSADQALDDLSPNLIVVLGIAGGITSDLIIGDVCISNEVIDVLQNSKVYDKDGSLDVSFAPDFYNIDAELVSSFTFLRVHPGFAKIYQEWKNAGSSDDDAKALGDAVRDKGPEFIVGPMACGPVVSSDIFNSKLKSLHRKVAAIETESGGVFGRLARCRVPAIAIRGISDLADGDKAELERRSQGGARRLAMRNASRLLAQQIQNDRFVNVAARDYHSKGPADGMLFPPQEALKSIVSELDREIRTNLAERSPEFRAKPESFYLPIPRAQKINYADDLTGRELGTPENLVDCLKSNSRIIVRLPRSYPSQALGWSLAYSLIRQQIDEKVVLPYVVSGEALNPPQSGFEKLLPTAFTTTVARPEFSRVIIIEEPIFHARNRMKFLSDELKKVDAHILIITKTEDSLSSVEDFVKENDFQEYELAQVSFSETAFFLEKAFDMTAREAELVAIRLDDTFRKFRLDAHPTYFAGIQEETLAALINANKRAELIQLAVHALLSLMVAADKSVPPLSRTTRERFLRSLVLEMACGTESVDDQRLLKLAEKFLGDGLLPTPGPEFLAPFFDIGLLYRMGGTIHVTHPYLESYLLAEALRERPDLAITYFSPDNSKFNFYAYDLYCEMGPDNAVIHEMTEFCKNAVSQSVEAFPFEHCYLDRSVRLTQLSSPSQLTSLTSGLMATAEKMEKDDTSSGEVRSEKQRMLDAKRHVSSQVGERKSARKKSVPDELQKEFETLDGLNRALSLSVIAVGSGSESISGDDKVKLAGLILGIAEKFSDLWTRNRMRIDFAAMRNDLLADENVWNVIEEYSIDDSEFDKVKADLQMFIHVFELNTILEPMGRIYSRIANTAGSRVLLPVMERVSPIGEIQRLIRSTWLLEISPESGKDSLKNALGEYGGSPLMRIVLASHLLWRVYWHHYKTSGARHFVNSARRALRPIDLAPPEKLLGSARKGAAS